MLSYCFHYYFLIQSAQFFPSPSLKYGKCVLITVVNYLEGYIISESFLTTHLAFP